MVRLRLPRAVIPAFPDARRPEVRLPVRTAAVRTGRSRVQVDGGAVPPHMGCGCAGDVAEHQQVGRPAAGAGDLDQERPGHDTVGDRRREADRTPRQIRAPCIAPRAAMSADARPGSRPACTGRRTMIVSADIEGHLPLALLLRGAVLGEEQLLQRWLPAQQLGDSCRRRRRVAGAPPPCPAGRPGRGSWPCRT